MNVFHRWPPVIHRWSPVGCGGFPVRGVIVFELNSSHAEGLPLAEPRTRSTGIINLLVRF